MQMKDLHMRTGMHSCKVKRFNKFQLSFVHNERNRKNEVENSDKSTSTSIWKSLRNALWAFKFVRYRCDVIWRSIVFKIRTVKENGFKMIGMQAIKATVHDKRIIEETNAMAIKWR